MSVSGKNTTDTIALRDLERIEDPTKKTLQEVIKERIKVN